MLLLYILLLGGAGCVHGVCWRHLQITVITLEQQIPGAAGIIATSSQQALSILGLVVGCAATLGIGVLFVGWWKTAAPVAGAFPLLVPATGSLMPRPMSAHDLDRIRADLEQRAARPARHGGPTARSSRASWSRWRRSVSGTHPGPSARPFGRT